MINFISNRLDQAEYNIMLYITDGAITDMKQTIDSIVKASNLPMSIIIVGVGNSDFSKMRELDGDDSRLKNSYGQYATRDIVQFVRFNDYSKDVTYLHEDVLREVPTQLVSYMMNNNISVQHNPHIDPTSSMF